MIKYIDMGDTLRDRETGACIPKSAGNRHYQEYLAWVAEGNTPIPESPGPTYVLNEDTWEIDPDLVAAEEAATAAAYLESTANLVRRYEEDITAGRKPFIPESKYLNVLKKRSRAQKTIILNT